MMNKAEANLLSQLFARGYTNDVDSKEEATAALEIVSIVHNVYLRATIDGTFFISHQHPSHIPSESLKYDIEAQTHIERRIKEHWGIK